MRCQLGLRCGRTHSIAATLVIRVLLLLLVFGSRILLDGLHRFKAFLFVQTALFIGFLDKLFGRLGFWDLKLNFLIIGLLELILFPGLLYYFRFLVLYFLFQKGNIFGDDMYVSHLSLCFCSAPVSILVHQLWVYIENVGESRCDRLVSDGNWRDQRMPILLFVIALVRTACIV